MKALLLTALLAGCGAELGKNEPGIDAFRPDDAGGDALGGPVDAPVDARPCTGGDARAVDATTGSCFVYFTGPLTYVEAGAQCTAMNSQLAVIKSAQTNATLVTLIGLTDAFVGADDRTLENTFRWLGSATDPVSGGYTNWRALEPNNGGGSGVEEDCMIIEGDQGTWDDRPCDPTQVSTAGRYAYICQYN